jgi:indolepyruvate decarboxylase
MNLGEVLLESLRSAGVRELFGIPGDFVLPLFRVIEERGTLPLYTLSHEPSVGFAADAAARWRCAPSAAVVTYGAGALNLVNPVAAAYAEKSPVVVVSGGPGANEDHSGLLLHHQAKRLDSQATIFREVTCAQTRLDDPAKARAELAWVLSECRRQSRPVYVEVPRDLVLTEVSQAGGIPPNEARRHGPVVDPDAVAACVDEISEVLATARSPVLMVGVEVRRFGLEREVAELAARLGIPLVTSFMGRGLLTDAEAPLIGTYLGVAGDPHITSLVEQSDGLVLLGVILSDTNFGICRQKIDFRRAVHVCDGQVRLGHHVYPGLPIADLVRHWLGRDMPHRAPQLVTQSRELIRPFHEDDETITPGDIAAAINQYWGLGQPLLMAADVGDSLFVAMSVERAHLIAPGYYASMGFGVPGGLGMQVASGHRPLVLVGDGAFQMTGWELGNCVRYGWDPVVVVLNNASWEMLRTFQPESRFNLLNQWNFAGLACALGGDGIRVERRSELATALRRALATRGRFQLVEVILPRGSVTSIMSRFAEGLTRNRKAADS